MNTITEITLDCDRKCATRVFEITLPDASERHRIEITSFEDIALPDESPRFELCDQPRINAPLVDPVLDLAIALRANRLGPTL